MSFLDPVLIGAFIGCQLLYCLCFLVDFFLVTRPVNWVRMRDAEGLPRERLPKIVLLYPVLRELEATMRTTFHALARMDYPRDRFVVIAIPNADDDFTLASLQRLQGEFPFLQIMPVPPTSHASWQVVWQAWDRNPKAYWWHQGRRAGERALPPKKTRQLIYAFYHLAQGVKGDWLLNYIDADSAPPADHFMAAAAGMQRYDVLQATNVAGNLLQTMASTWHAQDHMAWDGWKYPHLSADGKQPYWVLGKGLFYRASDLVEVGGFNPWLTIEDPEVGMRLWANGKRIGIIENPLIEEVPTTLRDGITQRKRWVCGFFQSLGAPLKIMGMSFRQRMLARLNFLPCLSLSINALGVPLGIWALVRWLEGTSPLPLWVHMLCIWNCVAYVATMGAIYRSTWKRTALVLHRTRDRLRYMWRINPVYLWFFWMVWLIPLTIGFYMYLRDRGQVWERTRKIDANHALVREKVAASGDLKRAA